jgi:L-ascorbate metabolism protein UlaG (beta-lactamase superfamily)
MLKDELTATAVQPGTVRAWWLGGTGFIFKTPQGTQIYIDPYLSDSVAAIFGQPRGFPAPIALEDVRPDLVIATHFHEDHLDPGGIPIIAKVSDAVFMCPPTAYSRALGWGVPRDRMSILEQGQMREFRDVKIQATYARHIAGIAGWEVPDAIGVIFDFDGLRIYHSGDTEYDLKLRALYKEPIDAALLVINGTGGNMDAHEAAMLAWHLGVKTAIPMHHILWKDPAPHPEATLDPLLFKQTYEKLGGAGQVRILQVGESIVFSK